MRVRILCLPLLTLPVAALLALMHAAGAFPFPLEWTLAPLALWACAQAVVQGALWALTGSPWGNDGT